MTELRTARAAEEKQLAQDVRDLSRKWGVSPDLIWGTIGPPLTARADDHPCELYGTHWPVPIRTQYHHSRPVYLQNEVYGRIVYPADFWVCGTCHDSLHEVISWLLEEGREPSPLPGPRTKVRLKAAETVKWYKDEIEGVGKA